MEVDNFAEQSAVNKEDVIDSETGEITNAKIYHAKNTDVTDEEAPIVKDISIEDTLQNSAENILLTKKLVNKETSDSNNVVADSKAVPDRTETELIDQQQKNNLENSEHVETNENISSPVINENNSQPAAVDSVADEIDKCSGENNLTSSETNDLVDISKERNAQQNSDNKESEKESELKSMNGDSYYTPVSPAEPVLDDISDTEEDKKEDESKTNLPSKPVMELRHMLEDIEEGELDYEEEDGELADDDLPDLPEYDPSAHKIENGNASEEGEIVSDDENCEREEGEIPDDEETGQVYVCVDPVNDKWKQVSREEQAQDLEEGQIDESEETKTASPPTQQPGRFIPRTLCKYFNNGLCRWGSTCRFLHPGINDKGIPADIQPTWNATAGNYTMHRPPGMYPNAFGKAPPPMECINVPVLPAPGQIVDMSLFPTVTGHPAEYVVLPVGVHPHEAIPIKESAWERGLRRAKEIKEAAARRREEDADFERKRLNMRIPENEVEKEPEFEAGVDPVLSAERTLNEWNLSENNKPLNEYYDRRSRDERRTERYGDRFGRSASKDGLDKSSGRARLAALPPSHPIRREERQRQRERERRERDLKEQEPEYKNKLKPEKNDVNDVPITKRTAIEENVSSKTSTATEWHDPWMRTQPTPAVTTKSDIQKQSGLEAISDSDSSSSDTDSDSESSSTDKSSDSDSGSSGVEKKKKVPQLLPAPSNNPQRLETTEPKNRKERRQQLRIQSEGKGNLEKNEPLSYEEWKRLQNIQKAQYHQQLANQYKTSFDEQDSNRKEMTRHKDHVTVKPGVKTEEIKKNNYQQDPRLINSLSKRAPPQMTKHSAKIEQPVKLTNMGNDDKFDSPKRKADSDSDSDSGSDSDSESSDSDSSDSDSEDSDSDSDSDNPLKEKVENVLLTKPAPVDIPAPRKDIKIPVPDKPKPADIPVMSLTGKRPARKDELLKELKAVEDAIARKRAKID